MTVEREEQTMVACNRDAERRKIERKTVWGCQIVAQHAASSHDQLFDWNVTRTVSTAKQAGLRDRSYVLNFDVGGLHCSACRSTSLKPAGRTASPRSATSTPNTRSPSTRLARLDALWPEQRTTVESMLMRTLS